MGETYDKFLNKTSDRYDRHGFVEWLTEEEKSINTIASYVKSVDLFFEEEKEFTKKSVLAFKQNLMKRVSAKTVNLRMCGLSAYAEWKEIPIKIKRLKVQKVTYVDNVISNAEYDKLLEGLKEDENEKWYIIVKFLACTGARVSELIQFKKKHLMSGEMELLTKGKIRTIYIPRNLAAECEMYFKDLNPDDYLFTTRKRKQITTRCIAAGLLRFSVRYGIPKEVMHPHSFRHRYAINFLQNNNDIALLADLMGHAGVNTTMIYLRKSKEEQRRMIDSAVDW